MYEIFEMLCKQRGITTYRFCKDTGITTSTISSWKTGRYTPKQEKLQQIADYFGVSLDFLMTGKDKDVEKYYLNDDTAQLAQKIFENKDLRVLFDAAADASPEDLKTAYDVLVALKKKERDTDD